MENIPISLSYLETLSTADLLELAEEYDLDIPEQLNRRFIISELLEIADELNDENILPEAFDPRVAEAVSKAVKDHIKK